MQPRDMMTFKEVHVLRHQMAGEFPLGPSSELRGHVHTVETLPTGALHGCTTCGKPVA